jgi:hypothetical protein
VVVSVSATGIVATTGETAAATDPVVGNARGEVSCIWNAGRPALGAPYTPYPMRTPSDAGIVTAFEVLDPNPDAVIKLADGVAVHVAPSLDMVIRNVEPDLAKRKYTVPVVSLPYRW